VTEQIRTTAPGRVVLIGDHTDYMGGLVLPMAIDLHTEVIGQRGGATVSLTSEHFGDSVTLQLPVDHPERTRPEWGRYVAGVVAEFAPSAGLSGVIRSTVPAGGGLSSSAALELAVALAVSDEDDPLTLARRCQSAEQVATGVPCGIMDQLCSAAGVEGHALLIDCATTEITPVPIPDHLAVWVVDSGEPRRLAESGYATLRAEAEAAAALVGPLPAADYDAIEEITDDTLRRRARHVRSECERVLRFAEALTADDLTAAGELVTASHRSLRDDAQVSTAALDALVEALTGTPGVLGARLTGAGFGGSVVALASAGVDLSSAGAGARRVRASGGARRR
jgi:galactokinase